MISHMKPCDPTVSLLITSTITPFVSTKIALQDSNIRMTQYYNSLLYALNNYPIDNIVFCENSGYDLDRFSDLYMKNNPRKITCEFVSQNIPDTSIHRDIGSFEMEMISHAFNSSEILSNSDYVIKITGRHYSPSIPGIVSYLKSHPGITVLCNLTCGLSYSDSRCFAGAPLFYNRYLFPLGKAINLEDNIWFENVLARAVHKAMGDGLIWSLPPKPIITIGQSGSKGNIYRNGPFIYFTRNVKHKLKLIAYGKNPKLSK